METQETIAIIGSRSIPRETATTELTTLLYRLGWKATDGKRYKLMTGGEGGVSEAAMQLAEVSGSAYEELKPDWPKYGKAAGPIRGKELIKQADKVLALWDGKSKGTAHELREAKRQGKPRKVLLIQ